MTWITKKTFIHNEKTKYHQDDDHCQKIKKKLKNTDEISCRQVTLFLQRCMCPAELQMDTRRWAKFYQGFDVYR